MLMPSTQDTKTKTLNSFLGSFKSGQSALEIGRFNIKKSARKEINAKI
jgi:hypothetical protein